MSVFLDRLMERVGAAEDGAAKFHALIDSVVEELNGQRGAPVVITGDVAADLDEARDDIVAAVMPAPAVELSGAAKAIADKAAADAEKARAVADRAAAKVEAAKPGTKAAEAAADKAYDAAAKADAAEAHAEGAANVADAVASGD